MRAPAPAFAEILDSSRNEPRAARERGADFLVPGYLRLALFRRTPVNRLGVVSTDLLADGKNQGVEATLVLAPRERRRDVRLEKLARARVGDHALEPVAYLDAGKPRLGEDKDRDAGVIAGRSYLPIGGGLGSPRREVALGEIAIHIDDDLRSVIVEQSSGPFARERRFDNACAIDKRLLGLRQRRGRWRHPRDGEDKRQDDRDEGKQRPAHDANRAVRDGKWVSRSPVQHQVRQIAFACNGDGLPSVTSCNASQNGTL